MAAANETTASMAAVASLRAIRTAGIDPDDIDLILLATLTPDYWMPSTAALVKEAIGNERAAAMDVAAACSGSCMPLRPRRPTSRAGSRSTCWSSARSC